MPSFKPGTRILGRFEILKQYHGGSFRVFFAIDRTDDRAVVLKFLPSDTDDPEAHKKLIQEAGLLSKVEGENVLKVYNCYLIDTGDVFVAMEWAAGGDLAGYLKKHGTLSWEQARELLDKILNGLENIHANNIIHRDIKPANILFSEDNTPLVADFGISKTLTKDQLIKRTSIIGTPEYMAPEAIKGKELGFATDIYSIGIVAWEMLTLKPPFRDRENNAVTIMFKHLEETPNFSVLPEEARDWIRMCLVKDPQKRISSVKELRRLLYADEIPKEYLPEIPQEIIPEEVKKTAILGRVFDDGKYETDPESLKISVIQEEPKQPQTKEKDSYAPKIPSYINLIEQIDTSKIKIKPTTRYNIAPAIKKEKHEKVVVTHKDPPQAEPPKIEQAEIEYTIQQPPPKKFTRRDFFIIGVFAMAILILSGVLVSKIFGKKTYHVALDGSADFTKIQQAIFSAGSGDTIYLHPGQYPEAITIEGKSNFVLMALDTKTTQIISYNMPVINMSKNAKAEIIGIEIINRGIIREDAILVDNSELIIQNCLIHNPADSLEELKKPGINVRGKEGRLFVSNCDIRNRSSGIIVQLGANARIENSNFSDNTNAIEVRGTESFADVVSNTIIRNEIGILASEDASVNIKANTIQRNITGISEFDIFWISSPLLSFVNVDSLFHGRVTETDSNFIVGNLKDRLLVEGLLQKICPNCGYRFYSRYELATCPRCYLDFQLMRKICPQCNTKNPADARGCKRCPFEFKY